MKISREYLRQIILEELYNELDEQHLEEAGRFRRFIATLGAAAAFALGAGSASASATELPEVTDGVSDNFQRVQIEVIKNGKPSVLNYNTGGLSFEAFKPFFTKLAKDKGIQVVKMTPNAGDNSNYVHAGDLVKKQDAQKNSIGSDDQKQPGESDVDSDVNIEQDKDGKYKVSIPFPKDGNMERTKARLKAQQALAKKMNKKGEISYDSAQVMGKRFVFSGATIR